MQQGEVKQLTEQLVSCKLELAESKSRELQLTKDVRSLVEAKLQRAQEAAADEVLLFGAVPLEGYGQQQLFGGASAGWMSSLFGRGA
jgi:hypothetical protein